MFECLFTLFSLAAVAYFVVVEPAYRRWQEHRARQRVEGGLPPPRFPPPEQNASNSRFDALLSELASFSREPVHEPGTGTVSVPAVPADTPDTNAVPDAYHRVRELVQQGYSGNQIVGIVGGKRADVLVLVRQARKDLGV